MALKNVLMFHKKLLYTKITCNKYLTQKYKYTNLNYKSIITCNKFD